MKFFFFEFVKKNHFAKINLIYLHTAKKSPIETVKKIVKV